jgi:ABC-type nitrate/sulfonate/bicarbonate transport system substrate-binding protein
LSIILTTPIVLWRRFPIFADDAIVSELKNKRIMLTDDTVEGAELQTMFRSVGLSTHDFKVQAHSFDPMSLARGETDAMLAYVSNEPFVLKKAGIETHAIYPKEHGFDYYSDILFTTQAETALHPERAEAFMMHRSADGCGHLIISKRQRRSFIGSIIRSINHWMH